MTTINIHTFQVEQVYPDWNDPDADHYNPWFTVSLAGVELHRSQHYVEADPGGEETAKDAALYEFAKRLKEVLDGHTP